MILDIIDIDDCCRYVVQYKSTGEDDRRVIDVRFQYHYKDGWYYTRKGIIIPLQQVPKLVKSLANAIDFHCPQCNNKITVNDCKENPPKNEINQDLT